MKNIKIKIGMMIKERERFEKEHFKLHVNVTKTASPSDQTPVAVLQETKLLVPLDDVKLEKDFALPVLIDASISMIDDVEKLNITFIAGEIEITCNENGGFTKVVKLNDSKNIRVTKFTIKR